MQLFSERSIRSLFERAGYTAISVNAFVNTYSLRYWMRLMPLPQAIKRPLSGLMAATKVDQLRAGFNVGNTLAAGFKPT